MGLDMDGTCFFDHHSPEGLPPPRRPHHIEMMGNWWLVNTKMFRFFANFDIDLQK
jgi:hypothetical protein